MNNIKFDCDDTALQNAIAALVERLPEKAAECLEKACLKVEGDAKKNCPAEAGTLRQSITYEVVQDENGAVGYVGSNLNYAPYVHEGTGIYARQGNGRKQVPWTFYSVKEGKYISTSGLKPTPFLETAVEANRSDLLDYFEGMLND